MQLSGRLRATRETMFTNRANDQPVTLPVGSCMGIYYMYIFSSDGISAVTHCSATAVVSLPCLRVVRLQPVSVRNAAVTRQIIAL